MENKRNTMKVEKIHIQNFRALEKLEIELNEQMNLIIGKSGTGKSLVLKAITIALNVLVRKIYKPDISVKPLIHDSDIMTPGKQAVLGIVVIIEKNEYSWKVE
jgi:predicted ATP-dependent endonuclease of OLD family